MMADTVAPSMISIPCSRMRSIDICARFAVLNQIDDAGFEPA